jgi:23S rRNA (adenine2503-C2)-methyltransferase
MRSFYDVTREELERSLAPEDANPRTLAKHLFTEVYRERRTAWSEVSGLSSTARAHLERNFDLDLPPVTDSQPSTDGSEKFVVSFGEGSTAETVLMPWAPYPRAAHAASIAGSLRQRAKRVSMRRILRTFSVREAFFRLTERLRGTGRPCTVCLSTQVGCAMGCTFCYTGTRGLKRNLDAGEIVQQLVQANRKARVQRVAFMGMGEPLHNLENLVRALRIIQDPAGLGMTGDRIHVSTSGLVPEIDELAERANVRLALSVNATTDELRTQIMPVNKRWPLSEVIAAAHRYERKSRGPILIEYVLLGAVNDTSADSARLVELLQGLDVHVHLIPFNGFDGGSFERPSWDTVKRFRGELSARNVPVSVRHSRGRDVSGACGQLGLSVADGPARGRRRIPVTSR